jgi:hypothetical protein
MQEKLEKSVFFTNLILREPSMWCLYNYIAFIYFFDLDIRMTFFFSAFRKITNEFEEIKSNKCKGCVI